MEYYTISRHDVLSLPVERVWRGDKGLGYFYQEWGHPKVEWDRVTLNDTMPEKSLAVMLEVIEGTRPDRGVLFDGLTNASAELLRGAVSDTGQRVGIVHRIEHPARAFFVEKVIADQEALPWGRRAHWYKQGEPPPDRITWSEASNNAAAEVASEYQKICKKNGWDDVRVSGGWSTHIIEVRIPDAKFSHIEWL